MPPTRTTTPARRARNAQSVDLADKKERTSRSTPAQRKQLEAFFERNPRPDANEVQVLAEDIGMNVDHVAQWFSSKRCRLKKAHQKSSVAFEPHNALQLTTLPPPANDDTGDYVPQPKRGKPRVNDEQETALQLLFDRNPHATVDEKFAVALATGLTTSKVNSWFTYTRATRLATRAAKPTDDDDTAGAGTSASHAATTPVKAEPSPSPSSGAMRTLRTRRDAWRTPLALSRTSSRRSVCSSDRSDSTTPRVRTRPTAQQLVVLKREFAGSAPHHKPSMQRRMELAQELDMPVAKITDWFRNSLASLMKRKMKEAETRDSESESDSDGSAYDFMDLDGDEDEDDEETEDELDLQTPRSSMLFGIGAPHVHVATNDSDPETLERLGASVLLALGQGWTPTEAADYREKKPHANAAVDRDAAMGASVLVALAPRNKSWSGGDIARYCEEQMTAAAAALSSTDEETVARVFVDMRKNDRPGVTAL